MGSAFVGAKIGSIASLYFAGSLSLFNILVLLAFKGEVLSTLEADPTCQGSAAESCFSVLLTTAIPIDVFLRVFVVAMLFAVGFGVYFDYLPGRSYLRRALLISAIMLVTMLFIDLIGLAADAFQEIILVGFQAALALTYGMILGKLYGRYTRAVEFQSSDPASMKVMVDRRNQTGKRRTFSLHSRHNVQASFESGSFKGWLVSGGVTVEDPKSPTSKIQVNGDGLLKAS